MNRKYFYFIAGFTIFSFLLILNSFAKNKQEPQTNHSIRLDNPGFPTYISGSGIVEPVSGNIMISSPFNRIVERINFSVNDQVKKGDVLFQLYNLDLKSDLKIKQKKYEESLSSLYKLRSLPREEDFVIAQETFNRDQAKFNQSRIEYCMSTRCARSQGEKCLNWYKYQQARAEFLAAQAQFDKINSGAWQPELKIAQDLVGQAKADVEAVEAELERTYVRSPIDGTILQMKIHEGEISDPSKTSLIVGDIEALNLRVSIDQFNEPRFQRGSPAVAFKQGDTTTEFSLQFIHVEPFMVPKKYLTNELQERVDTQIFEILYRIEPNGAHLFIGEQMDVYIDVEKK